VEKSAKESEEHSQQQAEVVDSATATKESSIKNDSLYKH
jgi:hypothetical protein